MRIIGPRILPLSVTAGASLASASCNGSLTTAAAAAGVATIVGVAAWSCSRIFRGRNRQPTAVEPTPAELLKRKLGTDAALHTDRQIEDMATLIVTKTNGNKYHVQDAFRALPTVLKALAKDTDDAHAWELSKEAIERCGQHSPAALRFLPAVTDHMSSRKALDLITDVAAHVSHQVYTAYETLPHALDALPHDRVVDLLASISENCGRRTAAAYHAIPHALEDMPTVVTPERRADLLEKIAETCGKKTHQALRALPKIMRTSQGVLSDDQIIGLFNAITAHCRSSTGSAFLELAPTIAALKGQLSSDKIVKLIASIVTQCKLYADDALKAMPDLLKQRSPEQARDLVCRVTNGCGTHAAAALRTLPKLAEHLSDDEAAWLLEELPKHIPGHVLVAYTHAPALLEFASYDRIPGLFGRTLKASRWGMGTIYDHIVDVVKSTYGKLEAEAAIDSFAAVVRHLQGGINSTKTFLACKAVVDLFALAPHAPTTAWWKAMLAADLEESASAILAMNEMLKIVDPSEHMELLESVDPAQPYEQWSRGLFATLSLIQAQKPMH